MRIHHDRPPRGPGQPAHAAKSVCNQTNLPGLSLPVILEAPRQSISQCRVLTELLSGQPSPSTRLLSAQTQKLPKWHPSLNTHHSNCHRRSRPSHHRTMPSVLQRRSTHCHRAGHLNFSLHQDDQNYKCLHLLRTEIADQLALTMYRAPLHQEQTTAELPSWPYPTL